MRHADTVDKIVTVYLASVSIEPFTYKRKSFCPKLLVVSPLLLRGHTCPSGCGACCGSFSLDFLPSETATENAVVRRVEFNHRTVHLRSDCQADISDRWCRNLDRYSGRCAVYDHRPMACDFELIRFLVYDDKVLITQKQYGRAWAMERLDGEKGALCEMLPPNQSRIDDVVRKLNRLKLWADHFGVQTRIPRIISWIEEGDHTAFLHLVP